MLYYILTSSHSHRCPKTEAVGYPYSWCLQETAEFVSVEIVWLALSPGRRRLRFSFQINNVKDPDRFRDPHCLAPVGGGGGYLLTGLFSVNRSFQTFCGPRYFREFRPWLPRNLTAKIVSGRRGASLKSVTIRLKAGNILTWNRKSSALSARASVSRQGRLERRRLSSWRLFARQPIVTFFPGKPSL